MDTTPTTRASSEPHVDIKQGLPMFAGRDPDALAREKADLADLAGKPVLIRWSGYARKTGPGWLQSAMTLGGGSAMASLFLGAHFQYELLWVQPVAMVLGIIMLSAMSYQTLSTGARPMGAMRKYTLPGIAWAWAIAALVSTVIWHFPQYGLAAGMIEDMVAAGTGWAPQGMTRNIFLLAIGLVILVASTAIVWNYGRGLNGIRHCERALKALVWMVIICFALVVIVRTASGGVDWGAVFRGYLPTRIPTDPIGFEKFMGALGAAVGINMTFLYPYTLLARGWGREHREFSRFDLISGMLIPFTIATSLMVIAAGSTLYGVVDPGTTITPVEAASMLEGAGLSLLVSRYIFGLGVLGMALSTITMHMLVSGFAFCEIFRKEPGGAAYRWACLIPAPGVLGVIVWKYMGPWIAVPTSAICGVLLPIAYIAFFILNNRKDYLGDDRPKGPAAWLWNAGMLAAIAATSASALYYLYSKYFAG